MLNSTVPVKAGTALPGRVDGIDVAQLLRDIGEASASTNPVDLFRLCLGAQRVLSRVLGELPAVAGQHQGGAHG